MWKILLISIILCLCVQGYSHAGPFRDLFYRGEYEQEEPEVQEEPKVKIVKKKKPEPLDYFGIVEHYNKFMAVEINPYLSINWGKHD